MLDRADVEGDWAERLQSEMHLGSSAATQHHRDANVAVAV